jgi:hypothetical protein
VAIANGTQLGKEYVEWNGHGDKLALLFKRKILGIVIQVNAHSMTPLNLMISV